MTSTYRYINTLVEMGYLKKDAKNKGDLSFDPLSAVLQ